MHRASITICGKYCGTLCSFFAVAMATACAPAVPDDPTWAEDVAPILAANCVRCHTVPAIDGAPDSFRLDIYEDWVADDGRVIRGAGTMASGYIQARIDPELRLKNVGAMPPEDGFAHLSDRQIEIVVNWAGNPGADGRPIKGEARAGNQAPTMEIFAVGPDPNNDGNVILDYDIRDPDGEIVFGEFRVSTGDMATNATVISRELHSGRGRIRWNAARFPDGAYNLFAVLNDPSGPHTLTVPIPETGTYQVDNQGNTAPTVSILRPRRDALLASAESPTFDIAVEVDDPDAADTLTMSVTAVLGDQRVDVPVTAPVINGDVNTVTWDLAGLDDGLYWSLEVAVSDGTTETTARVRDFIVSQGTTTETSADILDGIIAGTCVGCHPFRAIPGLPHDFTMLVGGPDAAGVRDLRGLIYRRVVQQRNMPPASANTPLDDTEIARLGEWLLAGAPQ